MCQTGPCREDERWTWIPMLQDSYEIEREHPDWTFEQMVAEVERQHPVKRIRHLTLVPGSQPSSS